MNDLNKKPEAGGVMFTALLIILLFSNLFWLGLENTLAKPPPSVGKWKLTVTVKDQFGEKVSGEKVCFFNNLEEEVFCSSTNKDGKIDVSLEQGHYDVKVGLNTYSLDLSKATKLDAFVTVDLPQTDGRGIT